MFIGTIFDQTFHVMERIRACEPLAIY